MYILHFSDALYTIHGQPGPGETSKCYTWGLHWQSGWQSLHED